MDLTFNTIVKYGIIKSKNKFKIDKLKLNLISNITSSNSSV